MAEFCSHCYEKYGFIEYDINLLKIALSLKKGRSKNILCEGCNIRAIYKDEAGNIFLGHLENGEIILKPIHIEEIIE